MQGTPESTFANKLRELREERGLSQSQLAAALADKHGITLDPTAITRLEGGSRSVRLDEAVAIADVLRATLPQMLHREIEGALDEQQHEVWAAAERVRSEARLLLQASARLRALIDKASSSEVSQARLNTAEWILVMTTPEQLIAAARQAVEED
jgi:transcriptional regulator with XRE-family HTH domain